MKTSEAKADAGKTSKTTKAAAAKNVMAKNVTAKNVTAKNVTAKNVTAKNAAATAAAKVPDVKKAAVGKAAEAKPATNARVATGSKPVTAKVKPVADVTVAKPASGTTDVRDPAVVPASDTAKTTAAAPERQADTKSVAAALLAARRKAAPALAPARENKPQVDDGPGIVKSGVEVADNKVKKTVVENKTPVAPANANAGTAPAPLARKPAVVVARPAVPAAPAKAKIVKNQGFKVNEYIVYPAHGVGEIVAIEEQEVAGYKLELFVISFIKDKMILKVPLPKIASVGMRKLADAPVVKRALDTLTGRARIKRTMWSRRAQEYEAKINSGDLVAIAEVVRDLYRSDAQPEQSYSERQLYEAALDRMAREIAVVQQLTDTEALKVIDSQLQKGPRRGKAEEVETEGDDSDDDGNIGEAA